MKKILLILGIILVVAGVYFFFSGDKGLQVLGLILFPGVLFLLVAWGYGVKAPDRPSPKTGWVHVPGVGDIRVNLSS